MFSRLKRALLLFVLGTTACGSDALAPDPLDPEGLLWSIHLNHRAVLLSTEGPYNTIRLNAIARTVTGDIASDTVAVSFALANPNDRSIRLDSDGTVTALLANSGSSVIASVQYRGVTRADTAIVRVQAAASARPLSSFSIQPSPSDSARLPAARFNPFSGTTTGVTRTIPLAMRNNTGGNVTRSLVPVYYKSSDPTIASINRSTGLITTVRPGVVTFTATTYAFDTEWTDSLSFEVTEVAGKLVEVAFVPDPSRPGRDKYVFRPAVVTITAGDDIVWMKYNFDPLSKAFVDSVDIVFDDPEAVQPGNKGVWGNVAIVDPVGEGGNIAPWTSGADEVSRDSTVLNDIENGTSWIPFDAISGWLFGLRVRSFPVTGEYRYRSTRYPEAYGIVRVIGKSSQ